MELNLRKAGEVKLTLINHHSSVDKQDINNLKNAFDDNSNNTLIPHQGKVSLLLFSILKYKRVERRKIYLISHLIESC